MENLDKLKEIVSKMSNETFVNFQTELQYAVIWNAEGQRAIERCIVAHILDPEIIENRRLIEKKDYFEKRTHEIRESPLYQVVREHLGFRQNWCGWFKSHCDWIPDFEPADGFLIGEAVKKVFKKDYENIYTPRVISHIHMTEPKELEYILEDQKIRIAEAEQTLEKYGFENVFTGEGDLIEIFMAKYN